MENSKNILYFLFGLLFFTFTTQAQLKTIKNFKVESDTIQVDKVSINPSYFKIFSANGMLIERRNFSIDFSKAQLIINAKKHQNIKVEYLKYPDFITKTYSPFDKNLIVPNTKNTQKLYSQTTNKKKKIKFFDGLHPNGFIARGLAVGNNQNAVINSELDLTLEGKLSEKVSIKANIYDTNFPLQENGYSQNITQFDRIFVEFFSDNWRLKGGDLSLKNDETTFLNFEKQVAGVEAKANLGEKMNIAASGAIVRGRFSSCDLNAIEGNQGPYKIAGNNELTMIIVGGSDRVFINGVQLNRGKNEDYEIDYNLAEIRFNTTLPITNDMRIRIEFQYSDRNYTRFVTYDKAQYKSKHFEISGYFYNENDAKNQPVQQSLNDVQKQILVNAGNDLSKMTSENAYRESFSEDRILYEKNGSHFEYSKNPNAELYNVNFTNVGENQGDYVVEQTIAIGTIYKYVGVNFGSYKPASRLVAPTSLQVAVLNSTYHPTGKTKVSAELAYSDNDSNLFSKKDDVNNKQIATKIGWEQLLIDKKWKVFSNINYQFIQDNFKTVQRFQPIEYKRDWNLINPEGNQQEFQGSLILNHQKDSISYQFSKLKFSKNFDGTKHSIFGKTQYKNTNFSSKGSFLSNSNSQGNDTFFRWNSKIEQSFEKCWLGGKIEMEANKRNFKTGFSDLSHQFKTYETYIGLGDSIKVFTKIGLKYRTNDSIRNNKFTQFNNRKTIYVDSKLIENKNSDLSVFANYIFTKNIFFKNSISLNSKVVYHQKLFKSFLNFGTNYETSSGTIARQEYRYLKTEIGKGFYTWNDYNSDRIQQFNEFETAIHQDQANYLRVALPTLNYLPTQRSKLEQFLVLNPSKLNQKNGVKNIFSNFYNQTNLVITNEHQRGKFNLNPFNFSENRLVALQFNFRNSLYFNRNLQNLSTMYSYVNLRNKQQYQIGNQENKSFTHQIEFQHKLFKFWVLTFSSSISKNNLISENFGNRNYRLGIYEMQPKFTFLYNKDQRISLFIQVKNKQNQIGYFEKLQQKKIGAEYFFLNKKQNQISVNFNLFLNNFEGKSNSPVGFQMLDGMQVGENYTWNLLLSKKLNSLLQLNLSYFGRKSKKDRTVHTGLVELRAVF